nr:MAG TPA: Terminase [Caudoviricetes sp.]DAQ15519.1 MAG TPA: Terminase [Caudoviricetes sp.]
MADRKELENILGHIHKAMLDDMLEDLKNPEKRTPQLYNAVIKELERNGIDCVPKAGDEAGDTLKRIMDNVKENLGDEIEFTRIA